MRQFVYHKPNGDPSPPVSQVKAMAVAGLRVILGKGPFTITIDGDLLKQGMRRRETLYLLNRKLTNGEVGHQYRVKDASGKVVFFVREVVPAIRVIDTSGNDKADFYWSVLKAQFPDISFAGAYVCKDIAGTNTLSQHSYGNAVDAFPGKNETLQQMANWAVENADYTHAENIIWTDQIWSRGQGTHYYSGEYHGHLHQDFDPSLSGPCGVKN